MRTNHFAKGGQIIGQNKDKYARIDITDKYDVEALYELDNAKQLANAPFTKEARLKAIQKGFDDLTLNINDYLISKDSNDITRAISQEIEARREQGDTDENLERYKQQIDNPSFRKRYIDNYYQTQKNAIDEWARYLTLSEYPVSFKYLMLKAVLNYNYNLKTNKLDERTDTTTRGFTPFDAGTLSQLYDVKSDFLLKDYAILQNENSIAIANAKQVAATSGGGKWIRFEGGRNVNEETLSQNARELSALVQDTTWCTKTLAKSQLTNGDFYVYATEANNKLFPRIGIRMEGENVAEVRGTASSAQDIEPEMLPIAEDFLENNIPNNSGKRWLDSIKYNREAVELLKLIKEDGINIDRLLKYGECVSDERKFSVDYGRNGHVVRLQNEVNAQIQNLPNKYMSKNEVCTDPQNFDPDTTKVFIGNLVYAPNPYMTTLYVLKSIGNLELVIGNFSASGQDIKDLGKLRIVTGKLKIEVCDNLTNINNIESCSDLEILGRTKYTKINGISKINSIELRETNINTIGSQSNPIDYLYKLLIVCPHNNQHIPELNIYVKNIETEVRIDATYRDYPNEKYTILNMPITTNIGRIDMREVEEIYINNLKETKYLNISMYNEKPFVAHFNKLEKIEYLGDSGEYENQSPSIIETPNLIEINIKEMYIYNRYKTIPNMPKVKRLGGSYYDKEDRAKEALITYPYLEYIDYVYIDEDTDIEVLNIKRAGGFKLINNTKITSIPFVEKTSYLYIENCPNINYINPNVNVSSYVQLIGDCGKFKLPKLSKLQEIQINGHNENIDYIFSETKIDVVNNFNLDNSNISNLDFISNAKIDYAIMKNCPNIEELNLSGDIEQIATTEIGAKQIEIKRPQRISVHECKNLEYLKINGLLPSIYEVGTTIITSTNIKEIVYDNDLNEGYNLELYGCGAPLNIVGAQSFNALYLSNTTNIEKLPDGIRVIQRFHADHSKINDLNDLEEVGQISFPNNEVKFDKLKKITDTAEFGNYILDTQNIEKLSNMHFPKDFGKIKKLVKVKQITGDAKFGSPNKEYASEVEDIGILQKITRSVSFSNTKIKEIKNLKTIGHGADFRNSLIKDISCVKSIGENIGNRDYGARNESLFLNDSKIKDISHIKFGQNLRIVIGNRVDLLPQLVGKGIRYVYKDPDDGGVDWDLSEVLKQMNEANKKSGGIVQLQNVNKARIITDGNMPF
jgi:hypothetical protein